jgi:protease-4
LLQEVAQGRVWSGRAALGNKLVDVMGGVWEAVALAKQAAGIPQEDKVTLVEVTRAATSPLSLLRE